MDGKRLFLGWWKVMKDDFSTFHPFISFAYFTIIILFSVFFTHPAFLCISLLCSIAYSIVLNRRGAVKFNAWMLPFLLLIAIIYISFNHAGGTILVYVNDNPVTLESIVYGIALSITIVSIIIWLSCFIAVMTSDKIIYLFGRILPVLSLFLSMILRSIPKFKLQIKQISFAQKCIGHDISTGNIIRRLKIGVDILSIFITWALEDAIETADSMKSRGFGLKGRTSFSIYRFTNRDKCVLFFLLLLICYVMTGAFQGECTVKYIPFILIKPVSSFSITIFLAYAMLCLTPIFVDAFETVKWRRLQCNYQESAN